jgi:hypothetical protein
MSLILTHIDRHGIVHAADSNLTTDSGEAAGTGTKVFDLPYLRAGLSLAGSYSVNGVAMDKWMPQVIADYEHSASPSLPGFSDWLRGRLEREMTSTERDGGCLVHVAGFVRDSAGQRTEFYFVRNITGIDPNTGSYLGMGPTFAVTEDFWTRDYSTATARAALAAGTGSMLYINGFPSGRIAYLGLMPHLRKFLDEVWNTAAWRFRPPKTLDEVAILVELHFSVIGAMFRMSDYSAPFIGGPVQTLLIRP